MPRPHISRAASAALGVAIAVSVVLAGCSSSTTPTGAPSAALADGLSFVLIVPATVEPGTYVQHAVDGVSTAAAALNASLEILEPSDDATVQQNVDAAMLENPSVIIGLTDGVLTEFDYTAASNLAQQFLLIDSAALEPTGNLSAALFRDYEADYLTGVEAATLAASPDAVAIVSPAASLRVEAQAGPFLAGLTSTNDVLKPVTGNVGTDEGASQEQVDAQATSFVADGATIIPTIGFGPGTTLLAASASDDFATFGHDFDQCAVSPGHVIDSTINRVDVVAEAALRDVIDGRTGLITSYGLAEGAVSLASLEPGADASGCTVLESADAIAAVAEARAAIIAGTVSVADPTYSDPSLLPQPEPTP